MSLINKLNRREAETQRFSKDLCASASPRLFCLLLLFLGSFECFGQSDFTAIKKPVTRIMFYKLGNKMLPVQVMQFGEPNGIICINLHDNEFTSVNATMSVLKANGGTLIKIQNNKERLISFRIRNKKYVFDPNRMFSLEGIKATLEKNGNHSPEAVDEIDQFANRLLKLIPDSSTCLVALHNNSPGHYSVKSYLPGEDLEQDAKEVTRNKDQDDDDIFFTTDSFIYRKMAKAGYNSIWQHNENAKRDGSLSVYFGERNRTYVNIETEHGKMGQYKEMLKSLLELLQIDLKANNNHEKNQRDTN